MIGLLLLFVIGRFFYSLAKEHKKNLWLFTILGIVSYYIGAIILLAILIIIIELNSPGWTLENENNIMFTLLEVPLGLASSALFYQLLKKQWKKQTNSREDILDDFEL